MGWFEPAQRAPKINGPPCGRPAFLTGRQPNPLLFNHPPALFLFLGQLAGQLGWRLPLAHDGRLPSFLLLSFPPGPLPPGLGIPGPTGPIPFLGPRRRWPSLPFLLLPPGLLLPHTGNTAQAHGPACFTPPFLLPILWRMSSSSLRPKQRRKSQGAEARRRRLPGGAAGLGASPSRDSPTGGGGTPGGGLCRAPHGRRHHGRRPAVASQNDGTTGSLASPYSFYTLAGHP
uniref:Uncharacterized protein n=1 Tax=Setaria viridis TaxID=4556 RepID=A0A4U6TDL3_SETVI|nr:hypothetical protein SEVIR_9G575600v2 [Setaria viridis]